MLPDVLETLRKRHVVLQHIMLSGSVGRRTLASSIGMTERVLRAETELLKSQGLIEIEQAGMRISETGKQLLADMEPFMKELLGLTELEEKLRTAFGLRQVIIVPGDSDDSPHVKLELGRAGAHMLRRSTEAAKHAVVAVTGGSTMAAVASQLTASGTLKGLLFVPARGGLGESVELQANTIASTMAKKTGGQYRLLHVPDHLSEEAYQSLIQEPGIQEVLADIRKASIVLHGIGEAKVMARRRRVDARVIEDLEREGANAEAFGYYFDRKGQVIHKMPTLGLRLEDIKSMDTVIAVAGGTSKGEAIAAVLRYGHEDILITDEAAAQQIAEWI
nr:sugar-binding domain-containing protein [Paenibacillus turpanensis]